MRFLLKELQKSDGHVPAGTTESHDRSGDSQVTVSVDTQPGPVQSTHETDETNSDMSQANVERAEVDTKSGGFESAAMETDTRSPDSTQDGTAHVSTPSDDQVVSVATETDPGEQEQSSTATTQAPKTPSHQSHPHTSTGSPAPTTSQKVLQCCIKYMLRIVHTVYMYMYTYAHLYHGCQI